jgi:O-antigen ligase
MAPFHITVAGSKYDIYRPIQGMEKFMMGWMGNIHSLGAYLAMALPFCLLRKWSRWLVIPIFAVLIMGKAITPLIAGACAILYTTIKMNKSDIQTRKLAPAILIVFIISTLSFGIARHGFTTTNRLGVWVKAFRVSMDKPLFGRGIDAFYNGFSMWFQDDTSVKIKKPLLVPVEVANNPANKGILKSMAMKQGAIEWKHAHNEYLNVFYDYGLIGLILLAWFLVPKFRRKPQNDFDIIKKAALIALCVDACAYFPMQLLDTAILGIFILAINKEKE